MAELIKKIPVKSISEAVNVVSRLADKYHLVPGDPDNILDVSNENLHVFYDDGAKAVLLETNDQNSITEYLKELVAEFPTFF
jgi:hypothetical protein